MEVLGFTGSEAGSGQSADLWMGGVSRVDKPHWFLCGCGGFPVSHRCRLAYCCLLSTIWSGRV